MLGIEVTPKVKRAPANAPDPRDYLVHDTIPILTLMDHKIPLTSDTVEMLMGKAAESAPRMFENLLAWVADERGLKKFIKSSIKKFIKEDELLGFVFKKGKKDSSDEDADAFIQEAMRVINGQEEPSIEFLFTIPLGIVTLIKKGIRELVKAVKTVLSDELRSKIGRLPDLEVLGVQAIEMIDEFVVRMEEKAEECVAKQTFHSIPVDDNTIF